jgi:urease accessory protein UreH
MVKLEPKKENLRLEGILGKFDVVGTTYIITREYYVEDLKGEINSMLGEHEGEIVGGASILHDKKGVIVRILGKRSAEVRNAILEIVRISRKQILGAPFSPIRKA